MTGLIESTTTGGVTGGLTAGIVSTKPKWLGIEDTKCFKYWTYRSEYLTTSQKLYRAGNDSTFLGKWWSNDRPTSISAVRQNKALPEHWKVGGDKTIYNIGYEAEIAKGQPAYYGKAAPQIDPVTGIKYSGGTEQIYLPEVRFHETDFVSSWKLKQ